MSFPVGDICQAYQRHPERAESAWRKVNGWFMEACFLTFVETYIFCLFSKTELAEQIKGMGPPT